MSYRTSIALSAFSFLLVCCGGTVGDDQCQPNDHTLCREGVVYWVDSCGKEGNVAENCECGCNSDYSGCEEPCGCCPGGPCCDGCDYRPSTYLCEEDVTTEYTCPDGTGCGADVYVHHQDRYCSGTSADCDGELVWDTETVFADCTLEESCTAGDSTCNCDSNCGCGCDCDTGPCCDGCSYRPDTYLCEENVNTEYYCPDGTGCGQDVYVHNQDRYCSGDSADCDGALEWDAQVVFVDCASNERCVPGDTTCSFDSNCNDPCATETCGNGHCSASCGETTSSCPDDCCVCSTGTCCDGCSYRPASYKCTENETTEYYCPDGTGCGADVYVHNQDRYCTGASAACDGNLAWDVEVVADDCASNEVCAPGDSTCNVDSGCGDPCAAETCGNGNCSASCGETIATCPDDCCVCSTGACCDGCSYRPASYKCQEDLTTEYYCPDGTACGADVYARHQDRFCTGASADCDGNLAWDIQVVFDNCDSMERCSPGNSSCNADPGCGGTCASETCGNGNCNASCGETVSTCPVDCCPCGSGPCCDGCYYRPASYKCEEDVTSEYYCPEGNGCGSNVWVRHQDRYCTGNSASCSGNLNYDTQVVHDECLPDEKCVTGSETCTFDPACVDPCTSETCGNGTCTSACGETISTCPEDCCPCTSGPCCDGCYFRPASTKCGEDETTEYYCAGGTGCGSDVWVRHQDRYCTGNSALCNGTLNYDTQVVFDECTMNEKCVPGETECTFDAACVDPCTTETCGNGTCRPECGETVANCPDDCCPCDTGPCCDGCSFLPASTKCGEDIVTEYYCAEGTGCGYDVWVRHQDRYCTGNSALCNGNSNWDTQVVYQDCAPDERCIPGTSACVFDPDCVDPCAAETCGNDNCAPECGETVANCPEDCCPCETGPCCDGCNFRTASYKCGEDVTTEYYCAEGTGCGWDVWVRHQDRYCTGASAGCDGNTNWDTQVVYDDCGPEERCVPGNPACVYDAGCVDPCATETCGNGNCLPECGETVENCPDDCCPCETGPCCDGCRYRPATHKCAEDVTTEYYCADGTGCGYDVWVRHQDRYCTGASADCNGNLNWDTQVVYDDCAPTERCTPGDPSCNADSNCP